MIPLQKTFLSVFLIGLLQSKLLFLEGLSIECSLSLLAHIDMAIKVSPWGPTLNVILPKKNFLCLTVNKIEFSPHVHG